MAISVFTVKCTRAKFVINLPVNAIFLHFLLKKISQRSSPTMAVSYTRPLLSITITPDAIFANLFLLISFITSSSALSTQRLFSTHFLAVTIGTSIAFEGFYDKTQKLAFITARLVVDDQMIIDPANNLTAPVNVPAPRPARQTVAPAPAPARQTAPQSALPVKIARVRRSNANNTSNISNTNKNASNTLPRRVSSRLAIKHNVAPSSGSVSINTDERVLFSDVVAAMEDVTSPPPPPFDALELLARGADADGHAAGPTAAAAVNASALESLSPARDDHSLPIEGFTIPAPQTTLETFFTAKSSSVLGKRKAEDDAEVDSLKDAVAAAWEEEHRAYEDTEFDAMMQNAQTTLEKLAAKRLAGEKQNKRRKVSRATTPAAAPKAPKALKAKAAVVPKFTTTTKPRVDPCLDAMDIDYFADENTVDNGVRQSQRIRAKRSAWVKVAEKVSRRKQTAPTLAALY